MADQDYIELARWLTNNFAETHGIADITMDESGVAEFTYDGYEMMLTASADIPFAYLTGLLCVVDEDRQDLKELAEAALSFNMFPDQIGDCCIAYIGYQQAFVLRKRINLHELPDNALDKPITAFLEGYEMLRPMMDALHEHALESVDASEAPARGAQPPITYS